jgi:hypothetical protein
VELPLVNLTGILKRGLAAYVNDIGTKSSNQAAKIKDLHPQAFHKTTFHKTTSDKSYSGVKRGDDLTVILKAGG